MPVQNSLNLNCIEYFSVGWGFAFHIIIALRPKPALSGNFLRRRTFVRGKLKGRERREKEEFPLLLAALNPKCLFNRSGSTTGDPTRTSRGWGGKDSELFLRTAFQLLPGVGEIFMAGTFGPKQVCGEKNKRVTRKIYSIAGGYDIGKSSVTTGSVSVAAKRRWIKPVRPDSLGHNSIFTERANIQINIHLIHYIKREKQQMPLQEFKMECKFSKVFYYCGQLNQKKNYQMS